MAAQHATTVLQPKRQLSVRPVHTIRYLHGARALRSTIAGLHGRAIATSATSLLTSLLLTCDAMPGVMNRLRRGGWVKFWTSQIVELSGEAERTQRRLRSVLRDIGALEERRLTSGQIAMRFDFKRLLAESPSIVGAPDDDVAVEEPEPRRETEERGPASVAEIRPYGAPELQTLSTTGSVCPARMRGAVGEREDLTNDLDIPEKIDGGAERPITSVAPTTVEVDATPPEPLSDTDRELTADVFAAFSSHPSVARSAKANPFRTPAAQATSRRVAAMIREGVPVNALASATTEHLDALYRQTHGVVWSPTYCEPAYDRLHSEWTMRRAQERRRCEEQQARTEQWARWQEEKADPAVVEAVMAKCRPSAPTRYVVQSTGDDAKTDGELRREIDAFLAAKDATHARGLPSRGGHESLEGLPLPAQGDATP
ncbi:hypothetical protein HN371_29310 [Candidatus Poribacteria bacterium]|nr:hypothetical protein [Candidatus Poribacteria bacterium]MBT5533489.1 hypothetical protein [Candidatus Poribacteria bacterium]MBT7100526.1 hypothetical protein [Candidatus Poribacteria bacterium]MBT7808906.1 hypothetical protein [Candidatus Poribacteria bacterium]